MAHKKQYIWCYGSCVNSNLRWNLLYSIILTLPFIKKNKTTSILPITGSLLPFGIKSHFHNWSCCSWWTKLGSNNRNIRETYIKKGSNSIYNVLVLLSNVGLLLNRKNNCPWGRKFFLIRVNRFHECMKQTGKKNRLSPRKKKD